jgi:alpha-glucosidase (family GH31 glycosyl hydrolase)
MKILFIHILLLVILYPFKGFCQQQSWEEVAPGVWKGIIGNPEALDFLSVAEPQPNTTALKLLPDEKIPGQPQQLVSSIQDHSVYLRFPLEKEEQLYGFGLNFKTIHQRGRILTLHVDHYGGKDDGRTHAPVPFYVSSRGYGVFINSARYLKIWAGTAVRKDSENPPVVYDRNTDKGWTSRPYSDAVEILVPSEGVEVYLFAGPTSLDVVRRYNLFMGGGCLPPRWGLGFTHRVHRLHSSEDVRNEVKEFNDRGYPLDFIGLEPGWQSSSYPCTFEWAPDRYPEPEEFVSELLEQGVRLNLWTNPYVSPESPIYDDIKKYTGSHTVWNGIVPDLCIAEAGEVLKRQLLKSQIDIGISGYKIDEVDGYDHYLWPDVATFPSGISAEQMRQTYGIKIQKMLADIYKEKNQRTYGLVRASNAGSSPMPFVLYNDYYNHEDFITALCNSGFSGILWTPEARNSKSAEEWLRRMQSVCFSPLAMINAWSSGTKPWSFPEVADAVRDIALLRMQLLPYFYSEFAKYHFEGTPPFRAMYLEPAFNHSAEKIRGSTDLEENPYAEAINKEIKDQYMAGELLLVAPMFTGQKSRKVVLPEGRWFDFYSGEFAGEGEIITVEPGLEKIPVYVKDGGIIPMMKPRLRSPKAGEKVDIEVLHYGSKNGNYNLYDDDGETFNYEKGDFTWRQISIKKQTSGNFTRTISPAKAGKPDNIGSITWKQMTKN